MIKKSLQLMTTPKDRMGMGISVTPLDALTVYSHDGTIDGFRAMAVYILKFKSAIIFTFNTSGSHPTINSDC